jgi:hypothetical protein
MFLFSELCDNSAQMDFGQVTLVISVVKSFKNSVEMVKHDLDETKHHDFVYPLTKDNTINPVGSPKESSTIRKIPC